MCLQALIPAKQPDGTELRSQLASMLWREPCSWCLSGPCFSEVDTLRLCSEVRRQGSTPPHGRSCTFRNKSEQSKTGGSVTSGVTWEREIEQVGQAKLLILLSGVQGFEPLTR